MVPLNIALEMARVFFRGDCGNFGLLMSPDLLKFGSFNPYFAYKSLNILYFALDCYPESAALSGF
jgi:hypothetical protein